MDATTGTRVFTNLVQLPSTTVVERPNDPTVGRNDFCKGVKDKVLRVPARGVPRDDSDADGDAWRTSVFSRLNKGGLSLKPNGVCTYKAVK